jgi:alpha(1,3/1,4) fucosyltransferase
MKERIKINFSDFWPGFDNHNNYFTKLLTSVYDVEISDCPDFLIHSVYSFNFLQYNCIRILYTAENIRPNFFETDYAFSFDYPELTERNFRFPYYGWRVDPDLLVKNEVNIDSIVASKTKFCNMVVSNANAKERIDFFHKLSKYKKVDSGGKYLNNIGGPVANKIEFIKDYKFTLAFENTSYPGYTTEKITEPMLVNSLAIYWGNPLVENDFNTKSFINIHGYKTVDEAIERIIEIDKDESLYREYLSQPYFYNNEVNRFVKKENILQRLIHIIENGRSFTDFSKRIKSVYRPLRNTTKELGKIKARIERRLK